MLLPCALKQLLGFDCPICGYQRSMLLLLKGDLKASFFLYPPLIPVTLLIGIFILYLLKRNIIPYKLLIRSAAVVLGIVMVNYVATLIFGHL
jgi:hypothetical protein